MTTDLRDLTDDIHMAAASGTQLQEFFVTAAPQPHLDGRYTAFGEVTKGQEVVDALLEGDSIIEVRATP